MALKPWYKVATPREDLRDDKPLDASEFAVHLDQIRDNRAPEVYQNPERFFERTYLTQNLTALAAEVIRRLSGVKTETSAVFNMSTQFGGGKTHALALLYHLVTNGSKANKWSGVPVLLEKSGVSSVPEAATAVFVGIEFDTLEGRGGKDGTPHRMTPWGEIAYQLGGKEAFEIVAKHDEQMVSPSSDVIRRFLPKDKACLILLDELMNYVSRCRKSGMATQLYNFLQNLSEEARGQDRVVLAVSIPASEMEMATDDHADYERFKKLLDRLGKAVIMSAETETSEIIRRRLFEWDSTAVSKEGKVLLTKDAIETCKVYGDMVVEYRQQIPSWFPVDNARAAFEATYPFHPMVLSVFERKWQALPRFQRTRGVLRLLALWVSRAFQEGFKGAQKDTLIGLGTAPLDDTTFRTAMNEQLGEHRLESAITTDICGKADSHSTRLDKESVDTVKKARLHRKVATAIFFESNGGQARAEATLPELRLAVTEPEQDIGNIETVLEALSSTCYFLSSEHNRYRFSLTPNLNKLLADRRASIQTPKIEERVREEIKRVFESNNKVNTIYYPIKSNDIGDRPVLTLIVVAPDQLLADEKTTQWAELLTRESGASNRTFKNALIWCIPDSASNIHEEARKVLAWEAINDQDRGSLDDTQRRQLDESIKKAQRDLKESVWRTYKKLLLLGKDNNMRQVDLGLVHSSAAESIAAYILNRLNQDGDVEFNSISPNFLVKYWSPAFKEWSTKSVRDAIYASPQFPRLIKSELIKDTIARGVSNGILAYVGKMGNGDYEPFHFNNTLVASDIDISEEMFIITREVAEAYQTAKTKPLSPPEPVIQQSQDSNKDSDAIISSAESISISVSTSSNTSNSPKETTSSALTTTPNTLPDGNYTQIQWKGEIPHLKWMNFYTKVITKLANNKGVKLAVNLSVAPEAGVSPQKVEEIKIALRELGLIDDIEIK